MSSTVQNRSTFLQNAVNSYVFELNNLGWANIDRFYSDPRTRSVEFRTTVIDRTVFDQLCVKILFPKQKVYLPAYPARDGSYFFGHNEVENQKLPVGEDAIVFATAFKNQTPYFFMQKIITQEQQNLQIILEPTTLKELKETIKKNI